MKEIWIFNGSGANFPSGVFSTKKNAEKWIKTNKLSGVLTKYPVDTPLYDWAINNEYFKPKNDLQKQGSFIEKFNSGYLEHEHYEKGE